MDAYIGEIRIFCGTFAPRDWALCNGAILPINQNTPLFAILGITYGGNGTTNFALPNLNGASPLGAGQGPGLSPYALGESAGSTSYTLNTSTMPPHSHLPVNASSASANAPAAQGNLPAAMTAGKVKTNKYANSADTLFNPQTVGPTGSSLPTSNMQPYLPLNFIICMNGIFPPRP